LPWRGSPSPETLAFIRQLEAEARQLSVRLSFGGVLSNLTSDCRATMGSRPGAR